MMRVVLFAFAFLALASCSPKLELSYEGQIEKSLRPFKEKGITFEEVRLTYKADPHKRAYVEIRNGRLGPMKTMSGNVEAEFIRQILEQIISEHGPLPDMALVFNLEDGLQIPICDGGLCKASPIFSYQASDKFADIPFPRVPQFTNIDAAYKEMRNVSVSWDSKIDAVVWRGSQTGGHYDANNWKTYARSKLVLKSKEMPDRIDAGFVTFTQVSEEAKAAILKEVGLKQSIPMEQQQRWKYIASLDGNGWADRFVRLLSSSSAVIKQDSPYYEFFYCALKPYEHYIPLARDLSDLETQIEWARSNPDKVKSIIKNANRFIDDQLTQAHVIYYLHKLLLAYGQLMK